MRARFAHQSLSLPHRGARRHRREATDTVGHESSVHACAISARIRCLTASEHDWETTKGARSDRAASVTSGPGATLRGCITEVRP